MRQPRRGNYSFAMMYNLISYCVWHQLKAPEILLILNNFTRPALRDARDILTGQKGLYRGTFLGVPMSFASRCNHRDYKRIEGAL